MRRFDPAFVALRAAVPPTGPSGRSGWCTACTATPSPTPSATVGGRAGQLDDPRVRLACRGCSTTRSPPSRSSPRRCPAGDAAGHAGRGARDGRRARGDRRGVGQRPLRLRHPHRGRRAPRAPSRSRRRTASSVAGREPGRPRGERRTSSLASSTPTASSWPRGSRACGPGSCRHPRPGTPTWPTWAPSQRSTPCAAGDGSRCRPRRGPTSTPERRHWAGWSSRPRT